MTTLQSVGFFYMFDIECPACKKEFRASSEMDEPPTSTVCTHCETGLTEKEPWDENEMQYVKSNYVGYLKIDMRKYEVMDFIPAITP